MIYADHLMTEESIGRFSRQYGDSFVWQVISLSDEYYVRELKKELRPDDPFLSLDIYPAARSIVNDDVLYIGEDSTGKTCWRLYHLTYSAENTEGFPRYIEFAGRIEAMQYISEHAKAE